MSGGRSFHSVSARLFWNDSPLAEGGGLETLAGGFDLFCCRCSCDLEDSGGGGGSGDDDDVGGPEMEGRLAAPAVALGPILPA